MAHAKYQFGQYFQTYEESSNKMSERTLDAIYAGPIGNNEGGFYAINLKTGQQIKRNRAIILPATQAVINRIQELATKDKMSTGLTFGDGIGKTTIGDITTTKNT